MTTEEELLAAAMDLAELRIHQGLATADEIDYFLHIGRWS